MIEITDKKHPLSTHAEITSIASFVNGQGELYATRIYYTEGQVVDGKLISLGNFDKETIKLPVPKVTDKDEPKEEYEKELAEYNDNVKKLDDFSKATDKVKWAENQIGVVK